MKAMKQIKDTLVSLTGKLGNFGQDKAASVVFTFVPMTPDQLMSAYRGSWLARKIVDIPASDMFRNWRDWQADENQIELLEAEEKRLNVRMKLRETMVKARLFGGAAMYISTGEADTEKPLDVNTVRKNGIRFLNVLQARQLSPDALVTDPESPYFNRPEFYTISAGVRTGAVKIHASRLVVFKGAPLPDEDLTQNPLGSGWGDSVLQACLDAIKNADSTAANIASLIFEAKIDIIKVPDLMSQLMDPVYEQELLKRFSLANVAKGLNSMLILDGAEEYGQKTANFSQLPDLMQGFLQIVSGAADIPATRLIGQAPAGMNSTGEHDLRNYYDRIQAQQTNEVGPELNILDECLIRSALGARPGRVHYIWGSLWQISDKERIEIGERAAIIITKLNDTGLYPAEALATAGANLMVEHSIMPGFQEAIDEAGGLPDYEAMTETDPNADPTLPEPDPRMLQDAAPRSLYVRRDVLNAEQITGFYRKQGVDTMDPAKMHVTVIHSKVAVDWFAIGEAWPSKIELPEGGARRNELFGPPGLEDSLVLMIKSSELDYRNKAFLEAGCVSTYAEYQPHITIVYKSGAKYNPDSIKPWIGPVVLGPEIYEEVIENWSDKS